MKAAARPHQGTRKLLLSSRGCTSRVQQDDRVSQPPRPAGRVGHLGGSAGPHTSPGRYGPGPLEAGCLLTVT